MDHTELYELYDSYARTLRHAVSHDFERPQLNKLSGDQFARIWQLLPEIERRRWLMRFNAGIEQVILSESSQYASILGNDDSASLKAA